MYLWNYEEELTMMAYLFPVHVATRMHLVLHPPVKNVDQTGSTKFGR